MDSKRKNVLNLATLKWVFLDEPEISQSRRALAPEKSPRSIALQSVSQTSFSQPRFPKSTVRRESLLSRPPADHIDVDAFQKRIPAAQPHLQGSSLPALKFPITARILAEKASRKPGYRSEASLPPASLSPRSTYKCAWYLPSTQWRQVQGRDSKLNSLQRNRGRTYAALQPYFFLHIQEKEGGLSFSQEFAENVKKFQKMPMMSKFKSHLESKNCRIPMFLDSVKAERSAEPFAEW